jgi:predicted alpha/beta-fold hydrolase
MPPFRPLPLLGNPHVQTVLGNLLRWTRDRLPARTGVVPLPDGDALAVHDAHPVAWRHGDPVVVLLHGLGGCHQSSYMRRMTNRLTAHGLRAVRVDLRGAGAGVTLARRFYNAGCSADIRAVLDHLARQHPASPLFVVGFSLGGNVALKLAGEAGPDLPPSLMGVAAIAPPIDLVRCSELIARLPFYDRFYVRHLVRQVSQQTAHFPDLEAPVFPRRLTLRQFDDLFTAPRWRFADAVDYYRRSSALPHVRRIELPCLIVAARDDPFVASQSFDEATPGPRTTIELARHGGHLGFLGGDGQGGVRWAEARIARWLLDCCQTGARRG